MRRIVAGAVCATLLGGCMSYRTSEGLFHAGGYTFAAGLTIGAVSLGMAAAKVGDVGVAADGFRLSLIVVPLGLVLGSVGLIGMAVNDEPSEEPVVATEAPAPVAKSVDDGGASVRRRADELTREALTASRAGDCAKVKQLGASVRALDQKVYTSVFATAPDLQRCLADEVPTTANGGSSGSQSTISP